MKRLFAIAPALALALITAVAAPALASTHPAHSHAAKVTVSTSRRCTETMNYAITGNMTAINETVDVDTCFDWIQGRERCALSAGGYSYAYGPWVDRVGDASDVSMTGTCSGTVDQMGFRFSKTGLNVVNCWVLGDGDPHSGLCPPD
jgi:hypothetical protein